MLHAVHLIRSTLNQAHGLLQKGSPDTAERLVRDLLARFPGEANSLHLLGLVLKTQGRFEEASTTLKKAIRNGADRMALTNSLGGVYYAQGDYGKSLKLYESIIQQQPAHADALYNSALCAIALKKADLALERSRAGANHYPHVIQFRYTEAQAYALSGQTRRAEACYRRILQSNPDHFHTLYALAILLRTEGRFVEAGDMMQRATALQPKSGEAWFSLANIHYQLGDAEAAVRAFKQVLALEPAHLEAHRLLNNLYFEFGYRDDFAKSFRVGIEKEPGSVALRLAHIDALLQAGLLEECGATLEKACQDIGDHAIFRARKGTLAARTGNLEEGVFHTAQAWRLSPQDPYIGLSLARYMIGVEKEGEALAVLHQVENLAPLDQNLWALRGTIWTLAGDHKKADWLFGYHRFIRDETVRAPAEYSTLEAFLFELKELLESLHKAKNAPLSQTLRQGTQTVGKLFDHSHPVLTHYKTALARVISSYMEKLPQDKEHPFLKRNTGQFDFSSSWSVRLTTHGFHLSHVHPVGWLSSAFYVAFDPSTVSDSSANPAGWLYFGVPGIDLPGREITPTRLIKPEPGLLVLFPSYCWHGTYPVIGEGMRLTAPFDVVPV